MTKPIFSMIRISRGDVNGFFGLFLNNLTNLIVLTGLLFSIGIPADIILARIIPGMSLAIFASSFLYFIFALKMAKEQERDDVTCLPTGLSVPHMFLIVFMVMLPVLKTTGDPVLAWRSAIIWTFLEGIVEILGAFVGPYMRKKIPRAALLGSLAGVSLVYIAFRPMFVSMQYPFIAFVSLAFIMLGWMARKNYFGKIPVGLIVLVLGVITSAIAGEIDFKALSVASVISLQLPKLINFNILGDFASSWQYIATAIPLGIYNFLETMDNLESASVAGDEYDTKTIMFCDGATSVLGCFFGAGFPTALYIGHPGWKAMGARQSYTLMSGIMVLLLGCLGSMHFFSILIPEPAILPILAFIGFSIASQAVTSIPPHHSAAVFVAIFPWLAAWVVNLIDSTIVASLSTIDPSQVPDKATIIESLARSNISYTGLSYLGNGAILVSIIWASFVAFIADGALKSAFKTALFATVLAYFGIIHGTSLGLGVATKHSIAYLIMSLIILAVYIKEEIKHKKGV